MGSKALLLLKAPSLPIYHHGCRRLFSVPEVLGRRNGTRRCSTTNGTKPSLQPPDVSRLAETARISLTQQEVEEFAPKIRQVVDWFGQLQAVDLSGVELAIRADTEGGVAREDIPETFENKDPMIAAVPSYDESYIKVPKVLNKE